VSTLPSRKLSAMFLCVFALGVVAGVLLDTNVRDMRFSQFLNRTVDPTKLAQRLDGKLAEQYHLDAAEQARIAPLTKEMAQNLYQVRRKFADDVLATLDDSHAKIGAQMTPDQRAAYAKDNVGRRQRAEALLLPAAVPTGAQP
jgi:hypothetical protein